MPGTDMQLASLLAVTGGKYSLFSNFLFESVSGILKKKKNYGNNWVSLVAQLVKNPPAMQRPEFDPWIRKIPWRR